VALPNSVKCSAVLSGVYDLVQYRNGEDDESIQGLGNIPFAHQGSQLSDEDLAKLSPMLRAKDMPGSIWVAYGTWSPEPQKEHQYKFSREAVPEWTWRRTSAVHFMVHRFWTTSFTRNITRTWRVSLNQSCDVSLDLRSFSFGSGSTDGRSAFYLDGSACE